MALKEEKAVRRSQLISPWGVGSILSLPGNNSVMIAGLDYWSFRHDKSIIIEDKRLTDRLGIDKLIMPPDFREKSQDPNFFNVSIPAVRFPRWHYCPKCGKMTKLGLTQRYKPQCSECNLELTPERFVVACDDNHIDDFPIPEWIHADHGNEYDPKKCKLIRQVKGISGGLSNVSYSCSCGANRSMGKAFNSEELIKSGIKCNGSKPWLNITHSECNKPLKTIQKGASNVWFGDIVNSIKIPTGFGKHHPDVMRLLDEKASILSSLHDGKPNIIAIDTIYESTTFIHDLISKEDFQNLVLKQFFSEIDFEDDHGLSEDDQYKLKEYQILKKGGGSVRSELFVESKQINEYDFVEKIKISHVSLVKELTAIRVLRSFSRLEPANYDEDSTKNQAKLSRAHVNWLPAVQSKGEGVFLVFDKNQIDDWSKRESVINRINVLNNRMKESIYFSNRNETLRPQFVFLHTLAHLIINEINLDSGYSASSIRERIYCERNSDDGQMYGMLLYTASGDSEGSLGGLVSQGQPGRLEKILNRIIENSKWCSSDPVCIESKGQGTDSMNLAACHNCTLLPETSCEHNNQLLDRALIHGTLNESSIGILENTDQT